MISHRLYFSSFFLLYKTMSSGRMEKRKIHLFSVRSMTVVLLKGEKTLNLLKYDFCYLSRIYCLTIHGHDPGVATCPPTIRLVIGCTVGTPHGTAKLI